MNDLLSEKDTKAVMEILVRELGVPEAQLTHDANLKHDLGADSLTIVEIHMALEDRFNLTVSDERSERVKTVGDVFELLAEFLGPRAI
jgi:acyl carrier protein